MRKLPVRMHLKHGAYYYVYQNKWTLLSRSYPDALRAYAGLVSPNTGMVPDLIDRWMAKGVFAPATARTYKTNAERLKTAFRDFKPSDVKPHHFYTYITAKGFSDSVAKHLKAVMLGSMQLAVEEGLVERNLIREVKHYRSKARDKYLSDSEYKAIRNNATETLKIIMDVCYLTGQRIGDVLSISYADLTKDGISFKQKKTGVPLCVKWNPDLLDAVGLAKALHSNVKGITLFHTREGKRFSYSTIRTLWLRAVKKSGVENANIHDIRAKAGTDAKKQGIDSKALLGHKSDQSHKVYLRLKEVPIVTGVKKVS